MNAIIRNNLTHGLVFLLIALSNKTWSGTTAEQAKEIPVSAPYVTPLFADTGTHGGILTSKIGQMIGRTQEQALWILPMAIEGFGIDVRERLTVEASVRLGLSQSGKYWVHSEEETTRQRSNGNRYARDCFSERCVTGSAAELGTGLAVATQYSRHGTKIELRLILLEADTGKIRLALRATGNTLTDSLVPFAREAGAYLISHQERPGVEYTSKVWDRISWLNPRDSIDYRRPLSWVGAGLILATTGLAWAEGQLLQRDDNDGPTPSRILDGSGSRSSLRGFFAAPTLGARYAAMGGAGMAQVNNGFALLMNPAGVAEADRNSAVAAKRTLPGGVPSLFIAYAGPVYGKWSQGLGAHYEGDALANETTVQGALAYDLSAFGNAWTGIKAGAEVKLYLANVGLAGTGVERSTGHSVGIGLDIGMVAHLSEKISAALAIRDAASFLRHKNTLTNLNQNEILPPEYRLGAAYQASPDLLLLMDGQKGIIADQADHVRFGAEQVAFKFLSLRCGMHQIFAKEAVRKISLGFGINADGLGDIALNSHVVLNYGYEFGLNEDQPLGGGQQFNLEMGF